MIRMAAITVLLGGVFMSLTRGGVFAVETAPAPIWPSGGTHVVLKVDRAPKLDDFDDAIWKGAPRLGPLCASGQPEAPEHASDIRLLWHEGTLYVRARCLEPDPSKIQHTGKPEEIWTRDSLEFMLSENADDVYPLLQVQIGPKGGVHLTRYLRSFGSWADGLKEFPDPALIKVRAAVDAEGWSVTLAVPAELHRIGGQGFRANIVRNRTQGPSGHAWVDLFGGRTHRPSWLGVMRITETVAARPAMALPAALAVGVNDLKFRDVVIGTRLIVSGKTYDIGTNERLRLPVREHGHLDMTLALAKENDDRRYGAEVRRPLIVHAVEPLRQDVASPLKLKVFLNVASDTPVPVEVTLSSDGKRVGTKTFNLAAGEHDVEVPHDLKAPGEVRIDAVATVPMREEEPLRVDAYHWCVLGKDSTEFDRFREGIDDLPTRSLLRAGVVDAGGYHRLIQTGEGVYPGRPGRMQANEWNRSFALVPALLYKVDWPENTRRGDTRFLDCARLGMEHGLDPIFWQYHMNHPPNREWQALLLTYGFIKDDVPAAQAAYWERRLIRTVEAEIETWIAPAMDLTAFYSDQTGTGTNHWAYHAANVYTAGKVFERPDWIELGTTLLRRLATHEQDGQFPERRDVPASTYTWLTMNALGEYYWQSGDESVKDSLLRCAKYSAHMTLPDETLIRLHDGRVNWFGGGECGLHVLSLTPEGRSTARRIAAETISSSTQPGRRGGMEGWFRLAEAALYFQPGEERPLPERAEFPFLHGRGLVARHAGHIYALSAICVPPIRGLFRLDPQNAFEWHHVRGGQILRGMNSQNQPEAGSFLRKVGGRVVCLPTDGIIQRTSNGHVARLDFDGFTTHVMAEAVDANTGRVKVELLAAAGDEPVIFSFFPGVNEREEWTLGEDAKTITFRNVTLSVSEPVQIERDFKLYNPYNARYGVATKPVRAFVTLKKHHPFEIGIRIAE